MRLNGSSLFRPELGRRGVSELGNRVSKFLATPGNPADDDERARTLLSLRLTLGRSSIPPVTQSAIITYIQIPVMALQKKEHDRNLGSIYFTRE
jgi:hypothetical protein